MFTEVFVKFKLRIDVNKTIIRRNGIKNDFFIIRKIHVGQLSFDGYQWEKRET